MVLDAPTANVPDGPTIFQSSRYVPAAEGAMQLSDQFTPVLGAMVTLSAVVLWLHPAFPVTYCRL